MFEVYSDIFIDIDICLVFLVGMGMGGVYSWNFLERFSPFA